MDVARMYSGSCAIMFSRLASMAVPEQRVRWMDRKVQSAWLIDGSLQVPSLSKVLCISMWACPARYLPWVNKVWLHLVASTSLGDASSEFNGMALLFLQTSR